MMNESLDQLLPVAGVRVSAVPAGIKYPNRDDVALLELAEGGSCAACFTQNAFRAAPVTLAEAHLRSSATRLLVINSGNANAGTGAPGMAAAESVCSAAAQALAVDTAAVLPFSTGVIGELLSAEKINAVLPQAVAKLDEGGWLSAAKAIMTTDTRPKAISHQLALSTGTVTITGIAKGSGMICPNMATMLGFIGTDAVIEQRELEAMLQLAVADSFNAITVDGDTSTNDACVLLASGASGVALSNDVDREHMQQALNQVCEALALMIVRDGEGATRCVKIEVAEASSREEARQVAYAVAHSPLVKTAMFAGDANWGRVLAAVGNANIEALDVTKISIYLDEVLIVEQGARAASYTEAAGAAVFAKPEYCIRIVLGCGEQAAHVFTTDLSHDYIRINAEYRS